MKTRRFEISACGSHADDARTIGLCILEGKVFRQIAIAFDDVTVIGPTAVNDIVLVFFVNPIVEKLIHRGGFGAGGLVFFGDPLSRPKAGSDEGIGIVVIGIGAMDIRPFLGVVTPGHRPSGIEKHVIVAVELAVGFTHNGNRHFRQVIKPRGRIDLIQDTAAIMVYPDMAWVQMVHVHAE